MSVSLEAQPDVVECVFVNDTATTEIYTLSLHDALPILPRVRGTGGADDVVRGDQVVGAGRPAVSRSQASSTRSGSDSVKDRKSTRLNSSHANISYAVFCLKKKKHYHINHGVMIERLSTR